MATTLDCELLRRTIALQVAQAHQRHGSIRTLLDQAAEIERWLSR